MQLSTAFSPHTHSHAASKRALPSFRSFRDFSFQSIFHVDKLLSLSLHNTQTQCCEFLRVSNNHNTALEHKYVKLSSTMLSTSLLKKILPRQLKCLMQILIIMFVILTRKLTRKPPREASERQNV
jgi:hypothetical protein